MAESDAGTAGTADVGAGLPATVAIGGDLPVRRLGYGAMHLAAGATATDRAAAIGVLRRAVDLGVTLIDTADFYGHGTNEELIAAALHPYPADLVIATKVGAAHEWDTIAIPRPEYLRRQAEQSLRRLRVERIDLLQLHRIDPAVPLADQLGAFRRLQEEGKVRHVGLSEVTVAQLVEARAVVDVATVQNRYNLVDRRWDPVVDRCTELGIAVLPWKPIATTVAVPAGIRAAVDTVGAAIGATAAQVSLAWLLHRSPGMLPIPGTTSIPHLEENVAAGALTLTPEQVAELTGAAGH